MLKLLTRFYEYMTEEQNIEVERFFWWILIFNMIISATKGLAIIIGWVWG